jgi:hypothetical protein
MPSRMNENRGKTYKTYPEAALTLNGFSMTIRRTVAILILRGSLAGCGVADLISNGLSHSRAGLLID